jgi:hypothetical protein
VIVNNDRFVGFKEQLGFLNFVETCQSCKKYKNTNFSSSMWKIFPRSKIFFVLRSFRRVQICYVIHSLIVSTRTIHVVQSEIAFLIKVGWNLSRYKILYTVNLNFIFQPIFRILKNWLVCKFCYFHALLSLIQYNTRHITSCVSNK